MKRYILYIIIALLAVTDGCKCGSGSGSGDVSPSAAAAEIKIGIAGNPVYPGDFSLTIDISGALNAAGIYFRLNFDPKVIQLKNKNNPKSNVSEGAFFNQGGVTTGLGVGFNQNSDSTLSDSTLIVGLSRIGGKPGVSGSGKILEINFTTLGKGSISVYFSKTAADNSLFTPELANISEVKWTDVEVTVK